MLGRKLDGGLVGTDRREAGEEVSARGRWTGERGVEAPGRVALGSVLPAAVSRDLARHEARQSRRCARVGAAALSLVLVAGLAACGGDDAEKARVAAAVKSSGDVVLPKAEPMPGAALVSNPPVETPPVTTVSERSVPENVTYGDAEKVYASGRYGEATELFTAYVERKPENPWGHYMLGLSAWKSGNLEVAESSLRESVKLSPNHVKGSINLARVLLDAGKAKEAVESATRATDLDPTNAEGWRVLGNGLAELGEYDGAEQAYREALVIDENDAWSMNNLGLLRIRHGLYEEALPPLARAVELKTENALFQNNLGVALERTGHVVEALAAYRKAVEVDPTHAKASASVTRLEPLAAKAELHPVLLTELAGAFRDEIASWKRSGGEEPDSVTTMQNDTTGVSR